MKQIRIFLGLYFVLCLNFEYILSNFKTDEEIKEIPVKSTLNDKFYVDKNGIFLVDDSNIDLFIKEFPFNLLFSTLHPCKLCRQIIPEIEKTINPLRNLNTPVFVGKLNITESPKTQIRLKLNSYVHLT